MGPAPELEIKAWEISLPGHKHAGVHFHCTVVICQSTGTFMHRVTAGMPSNLKVCTLGPVVLLPCASGLLGFSHPNTPYLARCLGESMAEAIFLVNRLALW